jgi:lipopolysaccharide transport system ATP-binding protein
MNKNIAIKVNNLTKSYKLYKQPIDRIKESLNIFGNKYHTKFDAVKDISFEIRQGETVGIIGRNGCGKSTLLKMISSVLTPSSGRVVVHGHISAILELGAGFNPEMTGLENIYLNSIINGLSKKQTDQKMNGILQFSELGEFIHQSVKTYSSGMKARLAFAVAINIEPDILIVDEALSVGDAAFRRKCFAKIEEIRANGATVLFVSHSESSIVSLCNRAIWLSNGAMILDGVPKLVTALYLKYSNAQKINKDDVVKEYLELQNRDDSLEMDVTKQIKTSKQTLNKNEKFHVIDEFYDPTLKSTSTIYYEENGARIDSVLVTTIDGIKVNVLVQGREYIYQYTVNIVKPLKNVQFGFLINSKNGIAIGGGAHPGSSCFLDKLEKNIRVKIRFKCELSNGEYYFNAGVLATLGEKIDYAHRIVDAYMIRVMDANDQITGIANFISNISTEDVK